MFVHIIICIYIYNLNYRLKITNMKKIIGLFLVALIPLYVSAGPDNIAPAAKVKASSSVPGYECQHVTDGIICIQDQGEWASNSSVSFYGSIDYPWIELEWDTPRSIDRIHLYDRLHNKFIQQVLPFISMTVADCLSTLFPTTGQLKSSNSPPKPPNA